MARVAVLTSRRGKPRKLDLSGHPRIEFRVAFARLQIGQFVPYDLPPTL